MSGGHKTHAMTSGGPGRLTGPKKVPRLGNRDFQIYITLRMLPIWHARQWLKLGKPAFSMPASARQKISLGFSLFKILPGTTLKALEGRIRPVGRMFDTPALERQGKN